MVFEKLEKKLIINGVTVPVSIEVQVTEDDTIDVADSFDFGDAKANEKYLKRFESGELFSACILVEAKALGESGVDSLGACHIRSNNLFNSTEFELDIRSVLSEHDMIQLALDDLEKSITLRANTLRAFAKPSGPTPLITGSEANARLVVAAPDLYDRADRLLEEYGNTGTVSRESMLELQEIMAKLTPKFKAKAKGGAE